MPPNSYIRSGRIRDINQTVSERGTHSWKKYEGDPTQRYYILYKSDEDPDIHWQKLLKINAQMENVGEGLTERRLIDKVIEKLILPKAIIKFNKIRDPINFSTTAFIQNSMRQTWIRAIPPEMSGKAILQLEHPGC